MAQQRWRHILSSKCLFSCHCYNIFFSIFRFSCLHYACPASIDIVRMNSYCFCLHFESCYWPFVASRYLIFHSDFNSVSTSFRHRTKKQCVRFFSLIFYFCFVLFALLFCYSLFSLTSNSMTRRSLFDANGTYLEMVSVERRVWVVYKSENGLISFVYTKKKNEVAKNIIKETANLAEM